MWVLRFFRNEQAFRCAPPTGYRVCCVFKSLSVVYMTAKSKFHVIARSRSDVAIKKRLQMQSFFIIRIEIT